VCTLQVSSWRFTAAGLWIVWNVFMTPDLTAQASRPTDVAHTQWAVANYRQVADDVFGNPLLTEIPLDTYGR
jgi:hypothetical protein